MPSSSNSPWIPRRTQTIFVGQTPNQMANLRIDAWSSKTGAAVATSTDRAARDASAQRWPAEPAEARLSGRPNYVRHPA